ncbi:WD40/YVTN/BNR-like repeat-containing protein [Gracilimonas sp. Q87]|uniref:WD40/YVTN/BNR-like repeat-containing protein n=1 Tax=Gracilimonas sp. Q87 TaxID=3384766 RepID=UPI003983F5D7
MKNQIVKFLSLIAMFLFLVLPTHSLLAQDLNMELLKGIEPRNVGPAGMSGRITAIDVVQSNTNVIYVGAASGGVWKSETAGVTWQPIFENYGPMAIGAIDIYQKNPSIIWMGTGEGNPRNSQSSGAGIYRSIDGGKSWELMGLEKTRNIHRVLIHPDDPNTVFVGAQGSAWGDSEERGVYKTTDGGKTWNKILYVNDRTGVGEMVMDPNNPNKLLVNMWEFRRWPWFFKSGGEGSGLYMTIDGGENWNELSPEEGLPEGELGRMGLAFAQSNTNIVYALIESEENAIYRSEDGGYTWNLREKVKNDGEIGNRPFYYAEIYVDPKNENRIYSLYSYLSISEDGGKSFESMYPYYNWVHPDHHAFWINPDNPKHMIDGNDGGLNITYDRGETWRFVDNIPVGQFYHVNVDMDYPYNIYGGMQDNGTWQGPAYVWRSGDIRNSYWEELFFGDGFDVAIDQSSGRYVYAMSQQGNVGRVDTETGSSRFVKPHHPEGKELRFNWNAAISIDPFDEKTIYFGSQYVHRSKDRGETWQIISPDLTTNDTTKQNQHLSGGLTLDATGAENYTTITVIEPSPLENGVIWAGTDDGNIQITRDDGQNWANLRGNLKGIPEGSWISQIKASHHNEGEAFAVINDYRRDNWTPYLLHTTNYGRSWNNIVSEDQVEGYSLSFVQDPVEPNLMFLGTEFGLYVSVDGGEDWTRWGDNYPTVSTYDMIIHPREHDLVIGTFGRSFWVIDDIRPLRELAVSGTDELEKPIKAFPSPDAYLAEWRQARGVRFAADAMFAGENRPSGALLSYSVNKDALESDSESDKKEEELKVKIEIFDTSRKKIRTLERTPEHNGLNRTTWGLDHAGVERPSRTLRKPNENERGGRDVLPGTYKVKFTAGEYSDSTMVTVHTDPRIEMPISALRRTAELEKEVEALTSYLAEAVQKLAQANEIVKVNKDLATADERSKEELEAYHDAHKNVQEKLDELFEMVFGEESDKQGIVRNPDPTVLTHLYAINRYLGSDFDGPGARERNLLQQAKEAVNNSVSAINNFVTQDWPEYQRAVENSELSPFKTIEPVAKD